MIIKATFHPRSIENSQAKNDCNKAVPNVKHRLSYAAFSSIYIGSCWEDFMQQTFQLLKFLLCIHVVFNAKLFFSPFLDLGAFAVEVMLRCDDVLLRSEQESETRRIKNIKWKTCHVNREHSRCHTFHISFKTSRLAYKDSLKHKMTSSFLGEVMKEKRLLCG